VAWVLGRRDTATFRRLYDKVKHLKNCTFTLTIGRSLPKFFHQNGTSSVKHTLVAIMDWHSRKVLSWRLSNTMYTDFCIAALEEALSKYGTPVIFNTDQGSQFTSFAFTSVLRDNGIRISMDGRGRWLDNVFIARLWRSLKYENVYLHAYESGSDTRTGIGKWIAFYNQTRPHSSLDGLTPDGRYYEGLLKAA
jgi:putative transposase